MFGQHFIGCAPLGRILVVGKVVCGYRCCEQVEAIHLGLKLNKKKLRTIGLRALDRAAWECLGFGYGGGQNCFTQLQRA